MKIVVLDGYPMNPGDLDWTKLDTFGDVTVYDRTSKEQVIERCVDAEIIINNKAIFSRDVLEQLPKLEYIGLTSTGVNVVDLDCAKERNIAITFVPAYSTDSVAQLVFSYILDSTFRVSDYNRSVKEGNWLNSQDFTFYDFPMVELKGKTIGIFGYGAIGKKVAEIAKVFGMKVLVCTRRSINKEDIEQVTQDELFRKSDYLTLHAPYCMETENLICTKTLALMKESAYVINTARGGLVNERDVSDALDKKNIQGFYTDVLSTEPPKEENPVLQNSRAVITPHIAWATKEARARLFAVVITNMVSFISGKTENCVQ